LSDLDPDSILLIDTRKNEHRPRLRTNRYKEEKTKNENRREIRS